MFFSSYIRSILNPKLINDFKRALGLSSFDIDYELSRISKLGRFKTGETNLIHPNFRFIDSESFINQFIEIFRNDILTFKTDITNPLILDCGSNVGVSVCYFKSIFPSAAKTFGLLNNFFMFCVCSDTSFYSCHKLS